MEFISCMHLTNEYSQKLNAFAIYLFNLKL